MSQPPIKVVYIVSIGRSGSTLLSRLLGELNGFTNVGETVRYLFSSKLLARQLQCGCGQLVEECSFWSDIVCHIEPAVQESGKRFARVRYIPAWVLFSRLGVFTYGFCRLMATMRDVLGFIAAKSNCRVVVDCSKNPSNAFILSCLPGVELHIIHLVRDPRGVVSSWRKPKGYLRAHSPLRVVWWWITQNLFSEFIRKSGKTYQRIRYEDFVHNPTLILSQMIQVVGEWPVNLEFLKDKTVMGLTSQHNLAGNPNKFEHGQINIRLNRWDLPFYLRLWIIALTWPFLFKYGYFSLSQFENSL